MSECERILLECRYILSLNKNYDDLAITFNINANLVYDDINNKLPKLDKTLYKRTIEVLNKHNSS